MSRSWIPKICDFGEARKMNQQNIKSIGRTLPYAPPELYDENLTLKASYDIYSFGMLMFEFIFDFFPIVIILLIYTKDFERDKLNKLEE